MKRSNLTSRYVFAFLAVLAAGMLLPVEALAQSASNFWNLQDGNLSDVSTKLGTVGNIVTRVAQLVLFVVATVEFIRFWKNKKWVDLLFVGIAIIGAAYASRIVYALWQFGSNS
ncbi:MAG: hypothetical protein PHE83_14960 [Opitutaceae bacterium]|nr:hypothetical protein [Opitutaceae bacterium]